MMSAATFAFAESAFAASGNVSITAASTNNVNYAKITVTKKVTYSGKKIKPAMKVVLNNVTLKCGVDYDVAYKNNVNVGTATVVVSGKGSYRGTAKAFFTIAPLSLSTLEADKIKPVTYDMKAKTPRVTLRNSKGVVVKWTGKAKYSKNVYPGTARILIQGTGNFTGYKEVTFRIYKRSLAFTTQKLQLKDGVPTVTLSVKKKKLTEGVDYKVAFHYFEKSNTIKAVLTGMNNYKGKCVVNTDFLKALSLKGKDVVIYGDSIQNKKNYKRFGAYVQYYAETLNAKSITNRAKNCATLSTARKNNNVLQQIGIDEKKKKLGTYDVYVIAAGTNDKSSDISPMSYSTMDDAIVCGALNKSIKKINEAHKKATGKCAKIIVISPIGRASRSQDSLRKDMATVCARYSYVTYIDGIKLATRSEIKSKKNSKDGLHPLAVFARSTIVPRLKAQMVEALRS